MTTIMPGNAHKYAESSVFTAKTAPKKFNQAAAALATAQAKKDEKETQWLEVAERAEALEHNSG
jgi:hypothetical protein